MSLKRNPWLGGFANDGCSSAATDPEMYDVGLLPPQALEALEADTFWCLSKLLDGIQDNYIFAQPGIQRQVRRMAELVSRIDRESSLLFLACMCIRVDD